MLDHQYLRYQIGHRHQSRVGIAAGKDYFNTRWFIFNQADDFFYIYQTAAYGTVDFIKNNDIIFTAVQAFSAASNAARASS